MILFMEFTSQRRMRFESKLDVEALPDLFAFIGRFSDNRGWDTEMKDRLSAVAEETLLTLAPLDLEGLGDNDDDTEETRRLVVLASSEGPVADLEFIGGGDEANLEDRIRQLQQHDEESLIENEISLLLLRRLRFVRAASAVSWHRHHHGSRRPTGNALGRRNAHGGGCASGGDGIRGLPSSYEPIKVAPWKAPTKPR